MRVLVAAPTLALLAFNPLDALMMAAGLVLAALVVEYILGWNRR